MRGNDGAPNAAPSGDRVPQESRRQSGRNRGYRLCNEVVPSGSPDRASASPEYWLLARRMGPAVWRPPGAATGNQDRIDFIEYHGVAPKAIETDQCGRLVDGE
jgi:hypothetical protein